ncbi:MAG: histidine--tRNA ligase, partial [Desulfuromonadales bacterium]|nr:histidine--tRNA ligase [Desulfuromonadales bacterium]
MKYQAPRGTYDILPEDIKKWHYIENIIRKLTSLYYYFEVRVPIFEQLELFQRSVGEDTDIVEKEMYTFNDKSENSLTMRPEGTAPVIRSFIQNRLHNLDPVSKLYYMGPMFRYERPQKGRYRQFHQIGVEVIGVEDAKIDAQVLAMLHQYFVR